MVDAVAGEAFDSMLHRDARFWGEIAARKVRQRLLLSAVPRIVVFCFVVCCLRCAVLAMAGCVSAASLFLFVGRPVSLLRSRQERGGFYP